MSGFSAYAYGGLNWGIAPSELSNQRRECFEVGRACFLEELEEDRFGGRNHRAGFLD